MEVVVDGAAHAVVGKLGQLMSEEYRLLSSVRSQVGDLRDDVAIMNALLRMLSEADGGAVDHFVREWMKQVRELAYDAEDCIDIFVLRISCVAPRGPRVLRPARHLIVTLRARHRLAADIEALRARALAVGERRVRYCVDGQALRPSASFGSSTAAASTSNKLAGGDPNHLVGIKDQVDRLSEKVKLARMTSNNQPDKKVKVFSIVGFGGLGKTTLAVEVCRKLEEDFTCQAIVSVSQAFDPSKDMSGLLHRILQQVILPKSDGKHKGVQEEDALGDIDGMEKLSTTFKNRLADKRYLIVIDDVWTMSAWEAIWSKFPDNNNDSRIIVTTRIETVAKACSPASAWDEYICRVRPLKLEESQTLFASRVFGHGNVCPDELKEAMENILKKCAGLPLAIVSIASLMSSYKSPRSLEMWTRVCNSIGSHMESNPTLEGMRQLITLSYNHLPHHLKPCAMYLGIFPEDYGIYKNRLLNRWIAEGLVANRRGLTSQEVAESYFDELLNRNIIQPGDLTDDGRVRTYRVHDMMLEVIVSKSLEENFVSLVGSQFEGTLYGAIRRLSIQGDLGSNVKEMSMQHVRSLSTFRPNGQVKLLDRLAEFSLLRVLDLEGCQDVQDHHLKAVCRMFLLRFLNLNGTHIKVLPSEIGDLKQLQYLWLHTTLLDGVPETVMNLEKLEQLRFFNKQDWKKFVRLPVGLGRMKALHRLERLALREHDTEHAEDIGNLVQLQHFEIILTSSDRSVLGELARSIGKLCSLRYLGVQAMSPDDTNMDFLHQITSPPHLLRHLRIGGKIDKFPDWMESLAHLVHIEFWWINLPSDEIYGVLYKLPNLLKITFDRLCCADRELVARTAFKFPVLRELAIVRDDGTPKVVVFEEGAMGKLERLSMCFYTQEKSLVGVENLVSLKEVELHTKRGNMPLQTALHHLQDVNKNRQDSDQFRVIVKYD